MNATEHDNPFQSWLDTEGNLTLKEAPPWRDFRLSFSGKNESDIDWAPEPSDQAALKKQQERALRHAFRRDKWELEVIRAALVLRRPILITGKPGVGKSSLAYVAAHYLNLGPVLRWDINSRSTVQDAVYQYDAIARLQAVTIQREQGAAAGDIPHSKMDSPLAFAPDNDIGRYVRLGPVGTALLPRKQPRVLLIDEIDKSDLDLPDDLLHVLEDGDYLIPELARLGASSRVEVSTADAGAQRAVITGGKLQCYEFPLILMTNNGERDFSSAFLRRCLMLRLERPTVAELGDIVERQLRGRPIDKLALAKMSEDMLARLTSEELTTDQFLNTFFAASFHEFKYTGVKTAPGIEQATLNDVEHSPVPPEDERARGKVGPGV